MSMRFRLLMALLVMMCLKKRLIWSKARPISLSLMFLMEASPDTKVSGRSLRDQASQ